MDFAAFERRMKALEHNMLSPPALTRIAKIGAEQGDKDFMDVVHRSLGADAAFTEGWGENPIQTRIVVGPTPGQARVEPKPQQLGVARVADIGRNHGASGFHGPGINRKTGVTSRTKKGNLRKVRAAKARRWNGVTEGYGITEKANRLSERSVPKVIERAVADEVRKVGLS